ncbi:hypothetical protein, partial [Desulfogranum japonicum]|uniref:hypothetical protein n=1 Tax=Desulfogranum japonicum TaxID=231447 RepID=UPI000553208E
MKKRFTQTAIAILAACLIPSLCLAAGNGKRRGNQDGSGPDRPRDGSCQRFIQMETTTSPLLTGQNGNRSGDRDGSGPDRDRDGSCLDSIQMDSAPLITGQNGNRSG